MMKLFDLSDIDVNWLEQHAFLPDGRKKCYTRTITKNGREYSMTVSAKNPSLNGEMPEGRVSCTLTVHKNVSRLIIADCCVDSSADAVSTLLEFLDGVFKEFPKGAKHEQENR